jgi:4-hydroxymandelate oxidase
VLPVLTTQLDAARSVLPAEVFDYYAAGSGDELTLDESAASWLRYRLRPRALRDVSSVSLATRLLGEEVSMPIAIAPTAFHRLAHPDAEIATVTGAAAAGALFVLSTRSSTRIAEVGAAAAGPWWFQVYVMHDRALTEKVVRTAVDAGASALVLTGDTPFVGRKRKVGRVRIALPDDHFLVNVRDHLAPGADGQIAAAQDPSIDLQTIEWLAGLSGLPVIVKGVLRGDVAVECLDAGAAGVIVSNHGGRQLDRAVPSALVLPEVVDAVGGRGLVMVDGGIGSGADVLVALALGASAVMVGRSVLWALASAGAAGVQELLSALGEDLAHVMALAGAKDLASVDRSLVTRA